MSLDIDHIRPYHDTEVHQAIKHACKHPYFKVLLQFTFPGKSEEEIEEILDSCHSVYDFQTRVIYKSARNLLLKSSDGFSYSGFDKLGAKTSYLFISNHRDIVLDTSLLNVSLYDHDKVMTASAIGDNLVGKDFLLELSKLNRNFLVLRDLPLREMLQSSKTLSQYMQDLHTSGRSVWIAQREGRTKDGNDQTQQGVLKMLAMAKGEQTLSQYLKSLRIVPVSISYEYDPTDILKVPELLAKQQEIPYVKTPNEDFNSILKGALGYKKRIHISVAPLEDNEYDVLNEEGSENERLQAFAKVIDKKIHTHYKLWPSNYIAFDKLHNTTKYKEHYDAIELRQFDRRLERRVDTTNEMAIESFLKMYATPVANAERYE